MNRRQFLFTTSFPFVAACGSIPSSPSQISPALARIDVIAQEDLPSIAEALRLANLSTVIVDRTDWQTTDGTRFSGAKLQKIGNQQGNWIIDINGIRVYNDVRHQPVLKDDRIGFVLG